MAGDYEHMFADPSRTFVHKTHHCSDWTRYAFRMPKKHPDAVTSINAAMDAIAEARGWTLEAWCKKAGVNYRTVQHWRAAESATRNPSVSMMQKLADAADVPFLIMAVPGLTADDVRGRTYEKATIGLSKCTAVTRNYVVQEIDRDLAGAKQA